MQIAELTGSKAATLTGLKDSRTVRRWVGGDTPIPFSAWAILVEYAGLGKIWKV
ncbi:putative transcriptional repressor protein korC [Escherichia coli 5-172-05_S4_C1]|nr:putative transcriptional repressor protein korC [Escherichia coli 5-172-05_S4_C1]CDL30085.1 KorC [Escherichia coli ISC7]